MAVDLRSLRCRRLFQKLSPTPPKDCNPCWKQRPTFILAALREPLHSAQQARAFARSTSSPHAREILSTCYNIQYVFLHTRLFPQRLVQRFDV